MLNRKNNTRINKDIGNLQYELIYLQPIKLSKCNVKQIDTENFSDRILTSGTKENNVKRQA